MLGIHSSVQGHISWSVHNADGSRAAAGAHKNLILDQGLDFFGQQYSWLQCFAACAVGTGNAVPSVSQTALVAESARTNNALAGAGNSDITLIAPNVFLLRRTFDFAQGALNGNYAEVGFSPLNTPGANLFSRALFQAGGNPVAVTVTSNQSLRVTYELTITLQPYPARRDVMVIPGLSIEQSSNAVTADQAGTTVTASGAIFDAASVGKKIVWSNNAEAVITAFTDATHVTVDRTQTVPAATFSLWSGTGGILGLRSTYFAIDRTFGNGTPGHLEPAGVRAVGLSANNDPLPAIIDTPSARYGTTSSAAAVPQAYTAGSFKRVRTAVFAPSEGNQTVGTIGFGFPVPSAGFAYHTLEFVFDNPFVKSNLNTLTVSAASSWGRG